MLRRSKSRRGQGLTEYGLLIALVLGILVLVVPTIGLGYGYINSSVSSAINSAIGGGGGNGVTPTPTPGGGTPSPTPAPPVTYRAAVLSTNPVAYWRLGEASDTTAVDEMGTYNGTYVGSPTLGATGLLSGDSNTAVTLSDSEVVSLPVTLNSVFTGTSPWTVVGWFNQTPPSVTNFYRVFNVPGVVTFWTDPSVNCSGFGGVFAGGGGGSYTEPIPAGVHQYAVVYTGTTVALYIDGALWPAIWGGTNPTSAPTPGAPWFWPMIGGVTPDGSNYIQMFTGTIDDTAIWNRVLTAVEVAALYAAGVGS